MLEVLGKMEIGPFAFGLRYGPCLAASEQRSSVFLTAERIAYFWLILVLVSMSFFLMLFVCNTELPSEYAKELQMICYDN